MLNKTAQVQRLLTAEESKEIDRWMIKDKRILPFLTTIINDTLSELTKPTSPSDFEKVSWSLERAHRDGGAYYLRQVLNIFKEK
jgi:hypothetical protein